ncbi:MAG: DUF3017 domain-containing protein [Rhodoferax sp.]|nr:DUF3017 domain-containing protein [Actinomycetota bacterium]
MTRGEPEMAAQRLVGPWLVLAGFVLVAVGAVVAGSVRLGGYLLAAGFALSALLRLVLPSRAVGAAAVRSRTTDVVGLALVAVAAAVLTATLNLAP